MQNENSFYEKVAIEIQKGHISPVLWTKSIAKANGNDPLAKSLYIQWRVEALQHEASHSTASVPMLPSTLNRKVRAYSQIQKQTSYAQAGRVITEYV